MGGNKMKKIVLFITVSVIMLMDDQFRFRRASHPL